jgi:hypothetical protein
MVRLRDALLVHELELGDEGSDLELALRVEVGDVSHHQVVGVEADRIPLLDEATQVVVTTDQFLKH